MKDMYKQSVIIWCIVVLYFTTACTADEGEIGDPTGVLEITEEEFNNLNNGEIDSLQVSKLEEHLYSSLKQAPDTNDPPLPVDWWKLFNQYESANLATFQTWANQYCRPYRSCWCCPNGGLCVAFFINPTSPRCAIINLYQTKLAVFEA